MKRLKQLLSCLLVFAMVSSITPTVAFAADDDNTVAYAVEGGNIYFNTETGMITNCDYNVTVAAIPSQINSIEVIGIDAWAFKQNDNLKSVTIPEGVASILNYAFEDCTNLTEVVLPESLEILGPSVFPGCKNLKHVVIQSDIQMSGGNFYGCEKLISAGPIGGNYCIEFSWTKAIPDNAFASSELQSIVFPSGIAKIGNKAFSACNSLANIIIPNSIVEIGEEAFSGCDRASSDLDLPKGLKTIGARAFENWDNVKEIIVPDSVTFIGSEAFRSCDALEHIVIPSSVSCDDCMFSFCPKLNSAGPIGGNYNIEFGWTEEIPDYAFCGMGTVTVGKAYLESVILPDSITRIGVSAFQDCTELKSIEIPTGVTEIGESAFSNCQSLKAIRIPSSLKTVDTFVFSHCDNLKNVVISDGVQNLESMSFGFAKFTSIFLPKSIQRIAGAFELSKLTDVYYAGSEDEWNQIEIEYNLNDSLEDATIHFNCVGKEDVSSVSVRLLSSWDSPTRQVTFGFGEHFSPYTYTLSDDVDATNIGDLLNKYVLVTMKQDESSVLEYTVTDIQPVKSAIGEVTATGEHSLTIDGTEYSVRKDFILGSYDGQELLYHIYNGTIMGFDTLETKTGTLDAWDSATGQITIDGTVYPTNYLSNLSFQNDINKYIKQKIKYSISGNGDYRPFIRIDELVKPEIDIAVFSTKKSLTVQKGDSMWLGFCKIYDGQLIDGWSKMAIVVSDPTIISLSEYKKTEFGYALEVTGKKQGATNVVITDTESGASTIVVITVRDSYAGTYSYAIDYMETFYPNNTWEKIQTNIYNLNGLYVNNYRCEENGNKYMVTFDVYNSMYHAGAVDIYDANGNWIDCEEISKYSMSTNMWDSIITEPSFLISDGITGKLLTYEQHSFAKHTPISIEVPEGGYFTISNNFAESPGTFLFNSCDILCDGTFTLIDAVLDVKDKNVDIWAFSKLVKEKITDDKTTREKFIEIFKKTAQKEVQKSLKKFVINEVDDSYADISGLFENILNSLDINWKHLFNSATGVGESILTKSFGPVGIALKGCFAFAKESNQLAQAFNLAASIDAPYATVFSSIGEGENNSHGVIVNTNGNMDTEAVLQVFRVSNNNTIEIILGGNGDHLKKYELYNICFVKNDQLVQPSGKVTVRIPIPDGMQEDTCNVYRQEPDGTWTILTAHIDGNYLVFETDHFSLYGIIGEEDALSISSLPSKTQYSVGETLDVSGLVLSLGGKQITDGFICEPTVLSQAGEQEITVRYGLASAKFNILVRASSESGDSGNTSAGGGSSGGGAAATDSYSITVKNVQNGTVTVSHKTAAKNTTITITATPDKGYTLGSVKVLDQNNKEIKLNQTNGKYTFTMPASKVTIQVVFQKETTTEEPASTNFVDVSAGNFYENAVKWAVTKNITTGTSDTTFTPDGICTRAQAVAFLWRAAGSPEPKSTTMTFSDVQVGSYYEKAVLWAVENGITKGTSQTAFSPNATCSRSQIVTFLWRSQQSPTVGTSNPFTDVAATAYYANAVLWAVEKDVTAGTSSTTFSPNADCTRAQIVTFLYRTYTNK